jgi:hypothetical protein
MRLGNPTEGEGWRDIYCREDGACLTIAVRNGWKGFNCEGCEGSEKQVEIITMDEAPIGVAGAEQTRKEDKEMGEIIKKRCNKCGEEKELSEFAENKRCLDGHEGSCRKCRLKRGKELRDKKATARKSGKRTYKRTGKRQERKVLMPGELLYSIPKKKTTEDVKISIPEGRAEIIINQLYAMELLNNSGGAYLLLLTTPESQGALKIKLLEELKGLLQEKKS